jgi:hypothetical protein
MSMRLRMAIALACVTALLLTASARTAGAAATLRSADLSGEDWSLYQGHLPPGTPNPSHHTFFGPNPFPNDDRNSATSGPDGLRVVVNLHGQLSHDQVGPPLQPFLSEGYTNQRFRVVFDVEEPSPFSYHRTYVSAADAVAQPTLQAEGLPPVTLNPTGDTTGTLPAGRYTFTGFIDEGSRLPNIQFLPFYAESINFQDLTLTVVPEPVALPMIGLGVLSLCRGPRRRAH